MGAALAAVALGAAACGGGGGAARSDTPGASSTSTSSSVPTVPAGGVPLGVYAGPGNPSSVAAFALRTGTAPSLASDYLPRYSGWAGMTQARQLRRYLTPWGGRGYRLVLAVPLIPDNKHGEPVATMALGAAGHYDHYFATLAHTLVGFGLSNAVLRLGWEFNADWYAWGVSDAGGAAEFASYFRSAVRAMRAVPGAHFRFVWNPNPGSAGFNLTLAYPGDAYVDYVGLDLYDQVWGVPGDPGHAWPYFLDEDNGLRWLAAFAAVHHKPAALPEWGVTIRADGHGLGDDPTFVADVARWVVSHDVAFTGYFALDAPDGAHDLLDGRFPRALAMFRRTFAATAPVPLGGTTRAEASPTSSPPPQRLRTPRAPERGRPVVLGGY